MKQKNLLIVLVAVIALAGGLFVQYSSNTAQVKLLSPAVEFSLPDVTGKQHNISEWQGKIVIINFWATWCPPCLKEIPHFIKLQNQYNEQGIQFIGIAIEDKQTVEEYLNTIDINYPMLIGGDEAITLSQKLGNLVNAVPFSLILNRQGKIIHRQPGELSREKILEIITPLI